jgi:hypothetical protein
MWSVCFTRGNYRNNNSWVRVYYSYHTFLLILYLYSTLYTMTSRIAAQDRVGAKISMNRNNKKINGYLVATVLTVLTKVPSTLSPTSYTYQFFTNFYGCRTVPSYLQWHAISIIRPGDRLGLNTEFISHRKEGFIIISKVFE